jgi:hypothetical protein
MRAVEFQFENGPKGETRLVKLIEHIIGNFNESMLRTSVIKMSPYVNNFIDKLAEIEKNGKAVLEVLSEYEVFQKKWLYL